METFKDYAHYYNAFYNDKDYWSEARQVDALLMKYQTGEKVRKILNFGCGTGRHDIALAAMGYSCLGIDMSEEMIKTARENAKKEDAAVVFEVNDIRTYEPKETYDAVISLFHVMSYQNRNEDVLAAFQAARKALSRGGLFLFDTWYGAGVLSDSPTLRVKEVETSLYKLVRVATPVMHDDTDVVDVCYEIFAIDKQTGVTKVINEVHSMRYFKPEMEIFLKMTGFELIENLDCRTLKKTDYSSWTSFFLAKAI